MQYRSLAHNSRVGVAIIIYTYIGYACTLLSPIEYNTIWYMELIATILFLSPAALALVDFLADISNNSK